MTPSHLDLEALYAAHPDVPRTVVKKIYEWKVSRDPDICPLYGGIITNGTDMTTQNPGGGGSSSTGGRFSFTGKGRMPPFPAYLGAIRRREPLIITMTHRQKPKNRVL